MKKHLISTLALALVASFTSNTAFAQAKPKAPVCAAQEKRPTQVVGQRVGKKIAKAFELYSAEDVDGALVMLMEINAKKGFDKAYTDRFIGNLLAAKGGADTKRSIPYLQSAYEANVLNASEHGGTIKLLAQLLMMEKEYLKSINMYKEWMRFTCKEDASTYLAISQGYYFLKQWDKLIAPADKAIALYDKPNKNPYVLKMQSYFERKMNKPAIKVVEELVRVFPTEAQWWTRLGFFYLLDENYDKALSALEMSYDQGFLKKESEIKTLASLYSQKGIPFKAGHLLETNLKKGVITRDAKMLSMIANSYHASKDLKKAAKYYGEAGKLDNDAEHYRKQGTLLLSAESYKAATVALKKALDLGSKKKGQIHMALMESYFYREDFKNAYVHVKQAIKDKRTKRNATAWEPYIKEKARNRGIKL